MTSSKDDGYVCLITDMETEYNDPTEIPYQVGDLIVLSKKVAKRGYANMASFKLACEYSINFQVMCSLDEYETNEERRKQVLAQAEALKKLKEEKEVKA